MTTHYNTIVIGSGGGSKITRPAANMGEKVAIIDNGRLGGTCLNHGCIPSKMLIHAADVQSEIEEAPKFGILADPNTKKEFKKLVERVTQTVDSESDSIQPVYDAHENITYYNETAQFISNNEIKVGDNIITGDKIFIVAGARAYIPPISGLNNTPYITYKECLRLTSLPKRMIVIGGGYIATELGYFFSKMGTEVTYCVRSQFLKQEDQVSKNSDTFFYKSNYAEIYLKSFEIIKKNLILGIGAKNFKYVCSNPEYSIYDEKLKNKYIYDKFKQRYNRELSLSSILILEELYNYINGNNLEKIIIKNLNINNFFQNLYLFLKKLQIMIILNKILKRILI
mgnify:CR=1 FL=1